MKRFAASTMLAGGLFAGLMGMAGAAHADLSDDIWNQQQQKSVDTHKSVDIPDVHKSTRDIMSDIESAQKRMGEQLENLRR